MTNKEIKDYKGKYLYAPYNGDVIYVTRVKIDGVWVDGYGTIIHENGEVEIDGHFDLGVWDSEKALEKYGPKEMYGRSEDEHEYNLADNLKVLTVAEARVIFNERIGNITQLFGF